MKYLQGQVSQLPWCEQKFDASGESAVILEELAWLNSHGFLTINSQPRVNGAPSNDHVHGWGGDSGYVFQKAYVEFFVNPTLFNLLLVRSAPCICVCCRCLDGVVSCHALTLHRPQHSLSCPCLDRHA